MYQVERFTLGDYEAHSTGRNLEVKALGVSCPRCGANDWFRFDDEPLTDSDLHGSPREQTCAV